MSDNISNTFDRNLLTRNSEAYRNIYRELQSKVHRMPLTRATLTKLRNELNKVESKATTAFAKLLDMGENLDKIIMTIDAYCRLIDIVDSEVNDTVDNTDLMDALEEERKAQEQAQIARLRRQQVESERKVVAAERRASGRGRPSARGRSPVRTAPSTSRERAPRRSPSPLRAPTTSRSPTADLRDGMNSMAVAENELKVYLSRENRTCGICQDPHQLLSRSDISVLSCGHCFHFLCAMKWHGDRRQNPFRRCAICRTTQSQAPPTTSNSLLIIGGTQLDEIFGPVPPPPDLTLH
jgi:hypothetical protein